MYVWHLAMQQFGTYNGTFVHLIYKRIVRLLSRQIHTLNVMLLMEKGGRTPLASQYATRSNK